MSSCLIVDAKDVETAHKITEEVESRLEERLSAVRVLIHVDHPITSPSRLALNQKFTH